jgi:hypothetical protein
MVSGVPSSDKTSEGIIGLQSKRRPGLSSSCDNVSVHKRDSVCEQKMLLDETSSKSEAKLKDVYSFIVSLPE